MLPLLASEGRFMEIDGSLLPHDEKTLLHQAEIRLIQRNMLEPFIEEP